MATHCSILPWRTPWAEEPGGLQSMGVSKSLILFETKTFSFKVFYKMIKRSSWEDEHTIADIFITPRLNLTKIAKLSFFFLFKEVYTHAGVLTRQPSRNLNTDSHKTVLSSFLFLKYTSCVPSSGPLYWTQNSRQISAWLISSLLWIELCPSKGYIDVLIPGTCECGLIWKSGLCRYNPIKMKSLKWGIIQHDRCL